ncbi:MAG: hypothetical protein ACI9LT_003322 [Pseudoalteromonas distincta]|jgi:hypothetical protein
MPVGPWFGGYKARAVDGVCPDDLRRRVSVLGVSQSLGLPYESAVTPAAGPGARQ